MAISACGQPALTDYTKVPVLNLRKEGHFQEKAGDNSILAS
jgi:hypothetical protein